MDKTREIVKQYLYCLIAVMVMGVIEASHASEFYTIIGPDGRPMIVQRSNDKKVKLSQNTAENNKRSVASESKKQNIVGAVHQSNHQSTTKIVDHSLNMIQAKVTQVKDAQLNDTQLKSVHAQDAQLKDIQPKYLPVNQAEWSTVESEQSATHHPLIYSSKQEQLERIEPITAQKEKTEKNEKLNEVNVTDPIKKNIIISQKNMHLNPTVSHQARAIYLNEPVHATFSVEQITDSPISQIELNQSVQKHNTQQRVTEIDGIQYVENEYLEDREFNLEGKKRFYIVPDSNIGGTRRFETLEREKGISKSVFSKFLKHKNEDNRPVVLAATYYRLPKFDVEQSLAQACFTGKKLEKAKLLSLDKDEIDVWPAAPINERLVYELIKLDSQVENIQLVSYASSQKSPHYYWPLAVFLDQNGCVLEGVSGFKNQAIKASNLNHSSIQGILKKPSNAIYLFLTPLAEAVDAPNLILSNKGQLELKVLH